MSEYLLILLSICSLAFSFRATGLFVQKLTALMYSIGAAYFVYHDHWVSSLAISFLVYLGVVTFRLLVSSREKMLDSFWFLAGSYPMYFLCFNESMIVKISAVTLLCIFALWNTKESFLNKKLKIANVVLLLTGLMFLMLGVSERAQITDNLAVLLWISLTLAFSFNNTFISILSSKASGENNELGVITSIWVNYFLFIILKDFSWGVPQSYTETVGICSLFFASILVIFSLAFSFKSSSEGRIKDYGALSFSWVPFLIWGIEGSNRGYNYVLMLIGLMSLLAIVLGDIRGEKPKWLSIGIISHQFFFGFSITFFALLQIFFIFIEQQRYSWSVILLLAYLGYNTLGINNLRQVPK
jgi:hypothetical protein